MLLSLCISARGLTQGDGGHREPREPEIFACDPGRWGDMGSRSLSFEPELENRREGRDLGLVCPRGTGWNAF